MSEAIQNELIRFLEFKMSRNRLENLSITWFGGEPLLAFRSMESITELICNLGVYFTASLITNGYLLIDQIASRLDDLKINNVQVTVDGTPEFHDCRRVLSNGEGTFYTIMDNIANVLSHSSAGVTIRVNIDETNREQYIGVVRFVQKRFSSEQLERIGVGVGFVNDIQEGCHSNPCLFDRGRKAQFLMDLQEQYGIAPMPLYPSSSRYECPARGLSAITVGPEGELYKCWHDVGNAKKIIGHLGESDLSQPSPVLLEYLTLGDPFEDAECLSCFLFPLCGGGCPYERIENAKAGKKIFDTCMISKDYLKQFLAFELKNRKGK